MVEDSGDKKSSVTKRFEFSREQSKHSVARHTVENAQVII